MGVVAVFERQVLHLKADWLAGEQSLSRAPRRIQGGQRLAHHLHHLHVLLVACACGYTGRRRHHVGSASGCSEKRGVALVGAKRCQGVLRIRVQGHSAYMLMVPLVEGRLEVLVSRQRNALLPWVLQGGLAAVEEAPRRALAVVQLGSHVVTVGLVIHLGGLQAARVRLLVHEF